MCDVRFLQEDGEDEKGNRGQLLGRRRERTEIKTGKDVRVQLERGKK